MVRRLLDVVDDVKDSHVRGIGLVVSYEGDDARAMVLGLHPLCKSGDVFALTSGLSQLEMALTLESLRECGE